MALNSCSQLIRLTGTLAAVVVGSSLPVARRPSEAILSAVLAVHGGTKWEWEESARLVTMAHNIAQAFSFA